MPSMRPSSDSAPRTHKPLTLIQILSLVAVLGLLACVILKTHG
ncbi:hypothetical protein D8I24_4087 (plasmid) [Cupriavidus necator H850]|nr:hypothetical protein D8I24_4087 [Cupriavidus necator H850]